MFDSGVGGLAVLAELAHIAPFEPILYVADQRHAPYGERTLAEVAARSIQIAGQLVEAGAKMVVVACNSASAAALIPLREAYPATPIVGMEPAVKPAVEWSHTGVVGVLATSATFQGTLFASLVDRHGGGATIVPIVGTGLADLVERGERDGPAAKEALAVLLSPHLDAGMDTLVLGCTHYSFLTSAIASVAGEQLAVVDPCGAVARQVMRRLQVEGAQRPGPDPIAPRYATTGDPEWFATQLAVLLDEEAAPIKW
jgi:glutamate racemase